jgi:hypothetical protein
MPFEKQKPKIIKDDNHRPIYLNHYGNETKTCRVYLEEYFLKPLVQMETLVNMLDDDAYSTYGYVCVGLLELNKRKIQKACDLIKEAFAGDIFIDTPIRDEITYDGGIPLGVVCRKEENHG